MLKNKELINELSLLQKAQLMSGKGEWESFGIKNKIQSMFMSDGPNGLRKQVGAGDHLGINASQKATCYPTSATLANSWDESLIEKVGHSLGTEAKAQNVQVVLGPGVNIKRNPKCGRNFEYYSEDPYLAGKMGAAMVRGIQSTGTIASPKHFAVNSQEYRRMASNSIVDERTLREIYLTNFEIVVKEGHPKALMSSYNQVNGKYANENGHLLTDILRKEWGFNGFVVTDWGGDNDHVEGIKNGSNLSMPSQGINGALEIVKAVKDKKLDESILDKRVDELIEIIKQLNPNKKQVEIDWNDQHKVAQKAARESIVLLKNEYKLLPLSSNEQVAVIGDFAKTPRYQGAGSSSVNAQRVENILEEIKKYPLQVNGYAQGYKRNSKPDKVLEDEAVKLAKNSDISLLFMGLDEVSESEGIDRKTLSLPQAQLNLLLKLKQETTTPVVVVISAGSSIDCSWKDQADAIVNTYLGGEASASATLDVLTGLYNPSGKLAETYVKNYEDVPFGNEYPMKTRDVFYKEGLFVGYRYYDSSRTEVCYPFGYGLSYTEFNYSDLIIHNDGVSFKITNIGKKDGNEISQLYIGKKDSALIRPLKELKGFSKNYIKSGETKKVTIPFDDKTFRFFDVKKNKWEVEDGDYQIYVGENIEDIKLTGEINEATGILMTKNDELVKYYNFKINEITKNDFECLYGKQLPVTDNEGYELGLNSTIAEMKDSKNGIARLVNKYLEKKIKKNEQQGKNDLNTLFIYNMPFRAMAKMTDGQVSFEMLDDILTMINGHFIVGTFQLIKDYRHNSKIIKKYS